MAGTERIELPLTEPESVVLPLDEVPVFGHILQRKKKYYLNRASCARESFEHFSGHTIDTSCGRHTPTLAATQEGNVARTASQMLRPSITYDGIRCLSPCSKAPEHTQLLVGWRHDDKALQSGSRSSHPSHTAVRRAEARQSSPHACSRPLCQSPTAKALRASYPPSAQAECPAAPPHRCHQLPGP